MVQKFRRKIQKVECDEVASMQDFVMFLQGIAGKNILKHNKYNVLLTHDVMEQGDERQIIFIDEFFLAEISENKVFHIFETTLFRPAIKDCKKLITVMVRNEQKVIFYYKI